MSRHADQVLDKQYNRPIANCQIYVYDSTGALATITADGGATLTNPFNADIYGNYAFNVATDAIYRIEYWVAKKLSYAEQVIIGTPAIFQGPQGPAGTGSGFFPLTRTSLANGATTQPAYLLEAGREGQFVFSTANLSTMVTADPDQVIYVAIATDATGASGAWVRKFNGPINFLWSGAVADDNGTTGTDCYQRLVNMLGLIAARANVVGIYAQGETLYCPRGAARGYYCSATVNVNVLVKFKGDWLPIPNATPQGFRFPLNTAGFIVNRQNTNGYTATAVTVTTAADGTTFEDFAWYSGAGNAFGGGAGFNRTGNFDGILVRARVNLIRCTILGFARDNIYAAGSSDLGGSGLLGNANCTNIVDCCIRYAGRNNVHAKGTDANACHMRGGYSDYALGWGVLDESAIGVNSFDNVHTEFNGLGDGTTTFLGATCAYPAGGQRYAVAFGQEATASTQTPGTGTAWINMGAGVNGGPTWVSGLTWYSGGSLALRPTAGLSRASNFYIESGQAPPQNNIHGHMEDGMAVGWGSGNTGTGETTIAPSGGPSVRVSLNPHQVSHTSNAGYAIEHTIGDATAGGDNRIRQYRNSNMTASAYVNERVVAADILGTEWNAQRLWWITGANPLGATISKAGRTAPVPYMTMPFLLKVQAFDDANEGRLLHTGSAAPLAAAGERAQGERVLSLAPAVGGIDKWYCYTGGTPGSWGADYINARAEPTVGVGYVTGAGGAVVQATSKGTGVTLNKVCGQITLSNAALAANTVVGFILTNSTIAATDCLRVNVASGASAAGSYLVQAEAFAAGSATISVRNLTAGSLSEALVLNFVVIKAVNA